MVFSIAMQSAAPQSGVCSGAGDPVKKPLANPVDADIRREACRLRPTHGIDVIERPWLSPLFCRRYRRPRRGSHRSDPSVPSRDLVACEKAGAESARRGYLHRGARHLCPRSRVDVVERESVASISASVISTNVCQAQEDRGRQHARRCDGRLDGPHQTLCRRRSRWPSGSPGPRACGRDRRIASRVLARSRCVVSKKYSLVTS